MKKYQYIIYRLLLSGSNNSISKLSMNDLSVSVFLFTRQLLVLLFYIIESIYKKQSILNHFKFKNMFYSTKLDAVMLLFCRGLTMLSFYYALQYLPVSFISVSEAAFSILFTVIVSLFLLKEKISLKKYFYLLMLIIGIILSAQIKQDEPISFMIWLLLILNGLTVALDSYYSNKLTKKVSFNFILFVKTISVFPIAIITYFLLPKQNFNLIYFNHLDFLSIFCFVFSAIATYYSVFFVIRSIEAIGSTKTNVITSIMPVVGILFAIIIFHEPITYIQLIGFFIVMVGIIGFNKK